MLILNSKKVIYIHIHKTGGESIELSLGKLRAWNDIFLDQDHPGMSREFQQFFGLNKHSRALDVSNLIGVDVWNAYFSWSTVRNPYERMASFYGYVASISEPRLSLIGFPVDGSSEIQRNWIASPNYPKTDPWVFAGVRAYLATRASASPFSEFLRHPLLRANEPAYRSQFSRLSNADGNSLLINRAIKLESLSSMWPQLCSEMGVPPVELQLKNETPKQWKRPAAVLFTDPADVNLINTIYADDFRWFGYKPVDSIKELTGLPLA
jgi:Sulfotransferase family